MADFAALSTQIQDLVICNACSERDQDDCQQVLRRVEIVLKNLAISGEVVSYGSAGTSLWTRGSALDLTILTSTKDALSMIYAALVESVFAQNIGWRQRGRVQVISYLDSVSRIEVWLTLNDEVGLSMRRLLLQFMSQDDRFFFLASIVKCWARSKFVCKPDSYFSGYVWTLLALHFLMQLRKSQIIRPLQYSAHDTIIKQGYDVWFDRSKKQPSTNTATLGELLVEFFNHYLNECDLKLDIKSGTKGAVTGHWISLDDPFTCETLTEHIRRGSQQHKRLKSLLADALEKLRSGHSVADIIN